MANKKISQLIPTTTLTDNAMFVVAEDNTNKHILLKDLKTLTAEGLITEEYAEENFLKSNGEQTISEENQIQIKENLNIIQEIYLTQSEYDALITKDPNVKYLIFEE